MGKLTFAPLPNATKALIAFLTSHAALAPLHGGRVGTKLQADLACLQVTPLGGTQPWPWESAPQFAISSWGSSDAATAEAEANDLDLAVRAAVWELAGTPVTGGRVIGVEIQLAGMWSPADDTGRPRVRSDVALTVMP